LKSIVIAGDLIHDWNLGSYQVDPRYHLETPPSMVLQKHPGGAWFLEGLIRKACSDLDIEIHGAPGGQRGLAAKARAGQAYQVWSRFPAGPGYGKKKRIWRIDQFLGCQKADPDKTDPLLPEGDPAMPDLLVLDDLCLGFRDQRDQWPVSLTKGRGPKQIILKTSSLEFDSPLWHLLQKKFSDRLTVILSVDVLRQRGAGLCKALSWDCTIEELVREVEEGASAQDLGACRRVIVRFGVSGVGVFSRCGAGIGGTRSNSSGRPEKIVSERAEFDRFIFDPDFNEGAWADRYPDRMFGALSILTAAVARHVAGPADYTLFIAIGRALSAMRENQKAAGGLQEGFTAETPYKEIAAALHPGKGNEPAGDFTSAYPRIDPKFQFGVAVSRDKDGQVKVESNLLRDLTGDGLEYVTAKAVEVVLFGPEKALKSAPKARYGYYLTVDRQEIERINTINNLIQAYKKNLDDKKPLAIAVFGPPGSGKSFAVKQLLSTVFPGEKPLEFNLAQFQSDDDLYEAFNQVRDISVKGRVPLVFWDEFDVDGLDWLKAFLAPMQDAEFMLNGIVHPLGRGIYVFAGGTSASFEEFDKSDLPHDDAKGMRFRDQKGPDFVSRLQGYVNIKGPQPADRTSGKSRRGVKGPTHEELALGDLPYLIRRAILLRAALQIQRPHLIHPKTGKAAISTDIIHAFLRAEEYHHGARSLNTIVRMSDLGSTNHFRASSLPATDIVGLHVTADFLERVGEDQLDQAVLELLAKACHNGWKAQKTRHGWKYGNVRNDAKRIHPLLVSYDDLPEEWKEANRRTARVTRAKLNALGYRIVSSRTRASAASGIKKFPKYAIESLMRIEHDIWLRDHLINGYRWAANSVDGLRLHRDIALFDDVPDKDQELDLAIAESIPRVLGENGYSVVKTGRKPKRK